MPFVQIHFGLVRSVIRKVKVVVALSALGGGAAADHDAGALPRPAVARQLDAAFTAQQVLQRIGAGGADAGDQLRRGEQTLLDELPAKPERGLEADHAVCGILELHLLLVVAVGRVIAAENLNRPVRQPLDDPAQARPIELPELLLEGDPDERQDLLAKAEAVRSASRESERRVREATNLGSALSAAATRSSGSVTLGQCAAKMS